MAAATLCWRQSATEGKCLLARELFNQAPAVPPQASKKEPLNPAQSLSISFHTATRRPRATSAACSLVVSCSVERFM